MKTEGQTVLVTGAAQGLGAAIGVHAVGGSRAAVGTCEALTAGTKGAAASSVDRHRRDTREMPLRSMSARAVR